MELIITNSLRTYLFTEINPYNRELKHMIGEIKIKIHQNKKAELLKVNFKNNTFEKKYWKQVEKDLLQHGFKFIYFLLVENMLDFNKKFNIYKDLGFKTDYKKLPVSIYYKNDQVYRIISMYIKKKNNKI